MPELNFKGKEFVYNHHLTVPDAGKSVGAARLDGYLTELATQKKRADKITTANLLEDDPELLRPVPNFALKTWEVLRSASQLPESRRQIPHASRLDGCGRAEGQLRDFDYEQDILLALDWRGLDVMPLVALIPDNVVSAETQMRRIRLSDAGAERIVSEVAGATLEKRVFDAAYAVRMVSDIVPHAWWARAIVAQVVDGLKERGFDDARLGDIAALIVEETRQWLAAQRNVMAEALFRAEVAAGRIQFRLRTDGRNWRMPSQAATFEPVGALQLSSNDGEPLKSSLFSPMYAGDFSNADEREIAVYLDADRALTWWHRNVARSHYALQGWRREKIYPDFIFAVQHGDADPKVVVLEMKGQHLAGNPDTEYKQSVLQLLTEAFAVEKVPRVGELEFAVQDGTRMACDLVLMTEWKTRLPKFSAKDASHV